MAYITAKTSKLYPNEDTKIILNKTMGSCRFVWNQLLDKHQETYKAWIGNSELPKPSTTLSYFNQELNRLKKEYPWLNEVSAVALQQVTNNLTTAFARFFVGKARYPQFKSKKE